MSFLRMRICQAAVKLRSFSLCLQTMYSNFYSTQPTTLMTIDPLKKEIPTFSGILTFLPIMHLTRSCVLLVSLLVVQVWEGNDGPRVGFPEKAWFCFLKGWLLSMLLVEFAFVKGCLMLTSNCYGMSESHHLGKHTLEDVRKGMILFLKELIIIRDVGGVCLCKRLPYAYKQLLYNVWISSPRKHTPGIVLYVFCIPNLY